MGHQCDQQQRSDVCIAIVPSRGDSVARCACTAKRFQTTFQANRVREHWPGRRKNKDRTGVTSSREQSVGGRGGGRGRFTLSLFPTLRRDDETKHTRIHVLSSNAVRASCLTTEVHVDQSSRTYHVVVAYHYFVPRSLFVRRRRRPSSSSSFVVALKRRRSSSRTQARRASPATFPSPFRLPCTRNTFSVHAPSGGPTSEYNIVTSNKYTKKSVRALRTIT